MQVNSLGSISSQSFRAKLSPSAQELADKTAQELLTVCNRDCAHNRYDYLQESLDKIDKYFPDATLDVERVFIDGKPRYEAFLKSDTFADKYLDTYNMLHDVSSASDVASLFDFRQI